MKKESILFSNGIFEYVELEEDVVIEEKKKNIKRKFVRRPPGVRALIVNDKKQILLSKEFRYEIEDWDYRLPGGKVFDDLESFKKSLENDTLIDNVYKTVFKEVKEEVGLEINNPKLIKVSKDGVSVCWDLYYFEIKEYKELFDTALEENEIVSGYDWYNFEDIIEMCKLNNIHEDRTIGVLLTYILNYVK